MGRKPQKRKVRIELMMRLVVVSGLGDPSALLRHEIAYCLGQRQEPASTLLLTDILADAKEDPM